jgi:hypothetical protein
VLKRILGCRPTLSARISVAGDWEAMEGSRGSSGPVTPPMTMRLS